MLHVNKYALAFLVIALLMVFMGCSRKSLSIFFDGVPEDNDTTLMAGDSLAGIMLAQINKNTVAKEEPKQYYHLPYREKECSACHDQNAMGKYNLPQPDLCYQCHEDFSTVYSVLHGPVEWGSCTECHSPHKSASRKLLVLTGQQLCFSCHDDESDTWKEIHDGIGDTKCTECHNPHGGSDNSLLN